MKKLINQTRYRCDFCKKEYYKIDACERHEHRCGSNPENFTSCGNGCVFLKEVEKEVETEYMSYDGSASTIRKRGFYCLKKQVRMYPVIAERRGLVEKYPDNFEGEIIFPKDCDDYEYFEPMTLPDLPVGVREYKK